MLCAFVAKVNERMQEIEITNEHVRAAKDPMAYCKYPGVRD